MTKYKLLMLFSALLPADLFSKYIAFTNLQEKSIVIINGFFNFTLAFNTGVSFSMFNDLLHGRYILAIIAIVAGLFLGRLALKSKNNIEAVGYTLVASGAFGNGIDRLFNGFVIDFIDIHYQQWYYPVFNLADCFIFIGVAVLLLEKQIAKFFTKK